MPSLSGVPAPFALLALSAVLNAGCHSQSRTADARRGDDTSQVAAVEIVQVREGALPLTERLTGTVRAAGEVGIFPEVSAPVAEVYVNNGDDVQKGDPLVRLRPTGAQSQLRQAQSGLNSARADLEQARATLREADTQLTRVQMLAERGLIKER